jgi:hypothetical protein
MLNYNKMTIITLDLNSENMTNTGGVFSESLRGNLHVGKRVKIISVISIVSFTTASVGFYQYLASNLINNNSYDSLTNGTSSILQVIDTTKNTVFGLVSTFYTDSTNFQIETVIPETITLIKKNGTLQTNVNDANPFLVRICMEVVGD